MARRRNGSSRCLATTTRHSWCQRASCGWDSACEGRRRAAVCTRQRTPCVCNPQIPETGEALTFATGARRATDNVTTNAVRQHVKLRVTAPTEDSGRGVETLQSVPRGGVLFDESPYLITPTGSPDMYAQRWRAYLTMKFAASRGSASMAAALASFDQLAIAMRATASVEAAAARLYDEAVGPDGGGPEREGEVRRVLDALMRFQSNQFKFGRDDGSGRAPGEADAFSASAVYAFVSFINHSCDPNAYLDLRWSDLRPGSYAATDGRVSVLALRDLAPGELVHICYGPKALVQEWPLQRRREYILERHGFVCRCPRCEEEERQQRASAVAAALIAPGAEIARSALRPVADPIADADPDPDPGPTGEATGEARAGKGPSGAQGNQRRRRRRKENGTGGSATGSSGTGGSGTGDDGGTDAAGARASRLGALLTRPPWAAVAIGAVAVGALLLAQLLALRTRAGITRRGA